MLVGKSVLDLCKNFFISLYIDILEYQGLLAVTTNRNASTYDVISKYVHLYITLKST